MKRKTISLHLLKDGSLEVRAPHRVSEKVLSDFVEEKKDWVAKAKERQANAILFPAYSAKELLDMRTHTHHLVDTFLNNLQRNMKMPVKVNIRKQKSVWGTCNRKGVISINLFCCLLPESLFEYIMIHELCHLVELNHSDRFWRLVEIHVPDWKERRKQLRQFRIR
jgi:predicted metal-dependent hydrolase